MFSQHDINQQTDSLANHLPMGNAWLWKYKDSSNGRGFLRGLAYELLRDEALLVQFWNELDPRTTTYFIDEWESALGIPDDCFTAQASIATRRLYVVIKMASLGVQTAQDFVNLAAILGITCTVQSGRDYAGFVGSDHDARFTIVVNFPTPTGTGFPLIFPYPFTSGFNSLIVCLFNHLKPATCQLIVGV